MREDWDLETTVLLISLAIIPVLVAIIILCLKIKSSKSNPDLYGVEGTVKKTKNEDGFNGSAGAANTSDNKLNVSGEDSRCDVRTPSYDRKLPDIPNDDIYKNSSTKDDNSELYATVDEVPANGAALMAPRAELASMPGPSNFDSKNHPYAKVKKTRRQEHPYAKVGEVRPAGDQEDNTDTEEYDTTEHLHPGPHLRGRPDHAHDLPRNPSRQATPLPPEPPPGYPDPGHGQQQHFSGDSQDSFSAKGYTSISVREPLAMIRDIRNIGVSQGGGAAGVIQEGNYVTLSETSDEMYAAIEDTVYMNPGGKSSVDKEGEESDPNNMYSKVDKVKKKNHRETKSYDESNPYATVNKPNAVNKQISKSSDNLGARPKQRSPRSSGHLDAVDYSEYEVAHTDARRSAASQSHMFNMARSYHRPDPNYETLPPYAESQLSERDPGYEMVQPGDRGRPRGHGRDPDYETVNSEAKDPGYEVVSQPRGRVNSIDPGYEVVPQKREPGYETVAGKDPGYESVAAPGPSSALDPGYETVHHNPGPGARHKHTSYGPRSFPTGSEYETVSRDRDPGYESVGGFRDPGYESVPVKRAVSLEPGYETLPERTVAGPGPAGARNSETVYSVVNKKPRAAPAPRPPSSDKSQENLSEEEGYETIPADKRKAYDPGYETLPTEEDKGGHRTAATDPGYETVAKPLTQRVSEAASTDPEYAKLKDADIEFIDESADELDDGLADLKTDELTVEGSASASSSLIQMSVVDSGPGVRRSSVVVIEHVPGAGEGAEEQEIQTHIFV